MICLQRTVRFAAVPPADLPAALAASTNGFAGRPAMHESGGGWGRHYELHIRCEGEIDPVLHYLLDIKEIDRAARAILIPAISAACFSPNDSPSAPLSPSQILRQAYPTFNKALQGIVKSVRLNLSPYYSVEMSAANQTQVLIRQRFDFAAAHRLHVPSFSEEENTRRFGKCNNPKGHGHNYQVEACVSVGLSPQGQQTFTLAHLEALVDATIIARFDHKHLNEDTAEFSAAQGVLPTVENIARVSFELLKNQLEAQSASARLHSVTVWETDRTSATYPAC